MKHTQQHNLKYMCKNYNQILKIQIFIHMLYIIKQF